MSARPISFLVLAAVACGGAGPRDVVEPRGVSAASGAPSIDRVVDLGDLGPLPARGPLPRADSDQTFVVGELVLIEGRNFGKLPTIAIGGQPAEALARTGNGGIVVRIPPGVPTGAAEVEVSHPGGKSRQAIEVTRHVLVVQPETGLVHVVRVDARGAAAATGTLEVPGARSVAISHDGQAAYVASDGPAGATAGVLVVVALTAGGGPRVVDELRLRSPQATFVAAAARAPVAAVVGAGTVSIVDLTEPRYPSVRATVDGGELAHAAVAAVIDPSGRVLALLADEGNRLLPVDLRGATAAAPVDVLPEVRVPLVRAARFAPAGDELWVLAGDNADSLTAGLHPARLLRFRLEGLELVALGAREVADVDAPLALGVARRESIIGGTAIRSKARRAVILVADADRAVVRSGAADQAAALGQLLRTDLEGVSAPLHGGDSLFTAIELSHDTRFALAATNRLRREQGVARFDYGLTVVPIEGGEPRFVRLGDGARAGSPLAAGSIAVAP